MAKQEIDLRKAMFASLLTIGIGVVLVIASLILQLLNLVITDSSGELAGLTYGEIVGLLYMVYLIITYPAFLALYFWTGLRAAKSYGFDAVGAGGVTAFAYFATGVIGLVLNMVLAAIVVTKPIGVGGFGSPGMLIASSLFEGISGLKGVALSAVCGIGFLLVGSLINFVIGGFGALFALRKSS